jgi:prefoldin subunit 5
MEITKDTRLADLIAQYPWLKAEMAKVNEKFKMLNTPVGKIMLGKATIAEMSKKSGMEIDKLVSRLKTLIEEHKD